jgi:ribulose-bisphosphate carboxylase small chain
MDQIHACRETFPEHYIKVNGYDRTKGRQTTMLSFIVHRPKDELGFYLERTESQDRRIRYTIRSKASPTR